MEIREINLLAVKGLSVTEMYYKNLKEKITLFPPNSFYLFIFNSSFLLYFSITSYPPIPSSTSIPSPPTPPPHVKEKIIL